MLDALSSVDWLSEVLSDDVLPEVPSRPGQLLWLIGRNVWNNPSKELEKSPRTCKCDCTSRFAHQSTRGH
jgi:hypothetical protein